MSDTAAVQALLDQVQVSAPVCVELPAAELDIDGSLVLNLTESTFSGGLIAPKGCRLNSTITNGAPILTINVAKGAYCRGQKFMGFDIIGSKADGHGLVVNALGDLYNTAFEHIGIENCGGDGLNATGAIFEAFFHNVRPRSNKGNGATLGNSAAGGIMSTIGWFNGSLGNNGGYGMELVNNFYDCKVYNAYFLLNGKAGLHVPNGIKLLQGGGFENNQQSLPAGQVGPAVLGQNFGAFHDCTEGVEAGGYADGHIRQSTLLGTFFVSPDGYLVLDGISAGTGVGSVSGHGQLRLGAVFGGLTIGPTIKVSA